MPRHIDERGSQEFLAHAEQCEPKTAGGSGEDRSRRRRRRSIRQLARQVLETTRLRGLEAEDGVRGLTVYQASKNELPQLFLISRCRKIGVEVLATLRRLNPTVRVILASGYSAAAQKLDLAKLG